MTRMTKAEYQALIGKTKAKSKYNNEKPEYYDKDLKKTLKFDSIKEYEYYLFLKDRAKRGEIGKLELQKRFIIQEAITLPNGSRTRAITYKADFCYYDHIDNRYHVIDVKGFKTEVYKLKKKLLAAQGIFIEEV